MAQLMRQDCIRATTASKWRASKQSQYRLLVAKNTLDRPVRIESPNRMWAGDLTYIWPTLPSCSIVLVLSDWLGDEPPSDRGSGRACPSSWRWRTATQRQGSHTTRIAAVRADSSGR